MFEWVLEYAVPFLFVLTVLVFVHELGHYLVARWNGVRVEIFSIGFGPELFGWTDKAQTRWKISAIPLGGYVKMFGDINAASMPDSAVAEMSPEERAVAFPFSGDDRPKSPNGRVRTTPFPLLDHLSLRLILHHDRRRTDLGKRLGRFRGSKVQGSETTSFLTLAQPRNR